LGIIGTNNLLGNNSGSSAVASALTPIQVNNIIAPGLNLTGAYSFLSSDSYATLNGNSGGYTVTLPNPATVGAGKTYTLIRVDNTIANVITIATASGTINTNGSNYSSVTANTQSEVWTFISDSSNWEAIHTANTIPAIYTPGVSSPLGTISADNMYSYRQGSYLYIEGQFNLGTTTTGGAQMNIGYAGVSAPSGLSITNQGGANQVVGQWASSASPGQGIMVVISAATQAVGFMVPTSSGTSGTTFANGNALGSSGTTVSVLIKVQIAGWFN
jgi:hypothetical protein